MASSQGRVLKTSAQPAQSGPGGAVCFWIGASLSDAAVCSVGILADDDPAELGFKRAALKTLAAAQTADYQVIVEHPDDSGTVTRVTLLSYDLSPVGPAVHRDFFSVCGGGIPQNAEFVFESAAVEVTVTPQLVRPHWAFLSELPTSVPTGRNTVRLQAPGYRTQAVPIEVSAGPRTSVRTLYPGAPKTSPYTIAFVANPAIEAQNGGTVRADPAVINRTDYHDVVRYSLTNLFAQEEDLLRDADVDAQIRLVAVCDAALPVAAGNALAHEISGGTMETRRDRLNDFLAQYDIVADYVSVLHDSATHLRASAWYTSDDPNRPSTFFTYGGGEFGHGHFARVPGSSAMPVTTDQRGLTAMHEFCHAASDFDNGRVWDLYVNGGSGGFDVNSHSRAASTDPIPVDFAFYNGFFYQSDRTRDGLGYPADWVSYHPALIDTTRPNLMDDYWQADFPLRCRLDRLTRGWLGSRLHAKIFR
ncbi:hypothetical protein [Streptomyces sp. NPDC014894]|uniref:hypothetical protein n=1 Tax=Streptomyces sp. NPDC014894 TaxID=3364931 RepID=UPI0036F8436D